MWWAGRPRHNKNKNKVWTTHHFTWTDLIIFLSFPPPVVVSSSSPLSHHAEIFLGKPSRITLRTLHHLAPLPSP
ncbi:hypothetical protein TWF506_003869 [Arthrobotrys conoides]|uniref:Uncharacterized protein n=1 Tax=Arthrobotrys conoides TaxID=74498 RepID=A0AAN8N3B0_9PEZI